MKYAQSLTLAVLIIMLSSFGVWNIYQYTQHQSLGDYISEYKTRLEIPKDNCDNALLSDEEYVKQMALNGDPNAQYVYASNLTREYSKENTKEYSSKNVIPREAHQWLRKAAQNDHIKAQSWFCSSRTQQSIDWCFNAAEHNHRNSQATIGRMYYDALGLEKNNEESYFWYKLAGNPTGMIRKVSAELTDEQKEKIDRRVEQWKPKQPSAKRSHSTPKNELILSSWNNHTMPINVKGLLCGGQARDCKISDRCGDLVGYRCGRFPSYFIASISEQKILNECPKHDGRGCLDLVNDKWKCKFADNLPLQKKYQDKFPKLRGGIGCGDYVYVRNPTSAGGGVYYSKITGKEVGKCIGPYFGKPQTTCTKPEGWYCD